MAFLDPVIYPQDYEKLFYWGSFSLWSTQEQLNGVREPSPGFSSRFPGVNPVAPVLPWIPLAQTPWLGCQHPAPYQPQDQSFGRSLPLDSAFTSLSLLALEMSAAVLTSEGNRAAGRWVYLHTATQQVGDRAAQEPGSCWPAPGREHTVLL